MSTLSKNLELKEKKISSVALSTLGCKLNFSETSSISNNLEINNFKVVPFNQYADAYIINTCSVTENADNKFKVFVNKALKINPNAFVAAIGCYAQLKPEELLSVKGVDLVLGASEKFNIVNYLQNIDQDFSKFDHFVDKLYTCNLIDLKIIEDFSEFEDEALGEDIDLEDTMTLLKDYVNNVETDLDKQRIKNLLQSLYIEAQDTV